MKRRVYIVAPTKQSAKAVDADPMLASIEGNRVRCLAQSDSALEHLPQAGPALRNDMARGAKVGLLSGALTGAAGGLLMYLYGGLGMGVAWVLAPTLIGALFGVFATSLVAASVPSKQLKPFQHELNDNKILLMIDVPKKKVQEVIRVIMARHPEVDAKEAHTTIPALP